MRLERSLNCESATFARDEIVIVVVVYRDTAYFRKFSHTLNHCDNTAAPLRLVVLLNEETERLKISVLEILNQTNLRWEFWSSPHNLLYWGAAASWVEQSVSKEESKPAWIVVANHDLEFPDPQFFSKLGGLADCTGEVVAPAIIAISARGKRHLNPAREGPIGPVEYLRWRVFFLGYPMARFLLWLDRIRKWPIRRFSRGTSGLSCGQPRDIWAPHGACMIFSKEYFARGGYLDTGFEFYAEEDSVAAIASRVGCRVRFEPSLEVHHREHSTTGGFSRWKWEKMSESFDYISQQYPETFSRKR